MEKKTKKTKNKKQKTKYQLSPSPPPFPSSSLDCSVDHQFWFESFCAHDFDSTDPFLRDPATCVPWPLFLNHFKFFFRVTDVDEIFFEGLKIALDAVESEMVSLQAFGLVCKGRHFSFSLYISIPSFISSFFLNNLPPIN